MNFLYKIFYKYQKIILIISFIIIVLLLGYLLYATFFKAKPTIIPPEEAPEQITTPGMLPKASPGGKKEPTAITEVGLPGEREITTVKETPSQVATGGLTKTSTITNVPSMKATLDKNGSSLIYYNKDDGFFYKASADGKVVKYSDKIFYNVENVTWSPNKEKAIIEYPDGANIVYDFNKEKQITLPKHWEDFDFSPNGNQIVMKSLGNDPSNKWLAISNNDGTGVKAIEPLGENEDIVYPSWSPNNQTIAMYIRGLDLDRQELFFVGLNNENFKSTILPGRGFEYQWDKNGKKLLYSVYTTDNDLKPSLWIVNAQGEQIGTNRTNLKVETWASKCAFADETNIYCAIPEELPEGSGLFPELANETTDNIYKINTITGARNLVAVPDGDFNMSNIIISENGEYLYFTDNKTGFIHKINLK